MSRHRAHGTRRPAGGSQGTVPSAIGIPRTAVNGAYATSKSDIANDRFDALKRPSRGRFEGRFGRTADLPDRGIAMPIVQNGHMNLRRYAPQVYNPKSCAAVGVSTIKRFRWSADFAGCRVSLWRCAASPNAAAFLLLLPGVASAQAMSHSAPQSAQTLSAADVDSLDARGGGGVNAVSPSSCFLSPSPSAADRTWFVTGYADRKAVGNLWDIASHAGVVTYDRDYLIGGAISYAVTRDIRFPIAFTDQLAAPVLEIEGQLDRHFGHGLRGLGHHQQGSFNTVEAVIAAVLRTPDFPLFSGISMNIAVGDGPSYSFTAPRWEYGYRHFNNYLTAEIELTSAAVPWLHLVPQVHHRSGAGGLIAPIADGSNFLGLGLRADLN
jgi:hypothetical protein